MLRILLLFVFVDGSPVYSLAFVLVSSIGVLQKICRPGNPSSENFISGSHRPQIVSMTDSLRCDFTITPKSPTKFSQPPNLHVSSYPYLCLTSSQCSLPRDAIHAAISLSSWSSNENLYSQNKYGRRVNNTNTIKTTQLQIRQKHLTLDSNLDTRLAHNTLGRAKPKYSWQYFTSSIFLVVKSFMKNLLITKSRDWRSDLVKGHASRPYSSTGKHLTLINWSDLFRGQTTNFSKKCIRCTVKWLFSMFQRALKRARV